MATSDLPAATVIDGRTLRLTSLNKVMYPETGTTKQEILAYYAAVAPFFLPHARMRPATRKRFVDGVGTHADPGKVFFEKNLGHGVPSWVQRRTMQHSDRSVTYPLINDAATLVWCAQMGALELHVPQWSFSRDGVPQNPDRLVLDLDPGPGAGLDACVEVAQLCRDILEDVGLPSIPVTSGSKGIHLYARLDGSQTSEQASAFARTLALALEADHPKLIVSDMKKSLRGGKVLLDWSQNNAAKTTVAPYSLRGTPRPRVACPREWDEIRPGLQHLEMYEVIERVTESGDAMAPLRSAGSDEPPARDAVPPPPPGPSAAMKSRTSRVAGSLQPRPRTVTRGSLSTPRPAATDPAPAGAPDAKALRPMQARIGAPAQVRGPGWAYEVKWDGYRALVGLRDGKITLTSRNGVDLTGGYPELQEAAGAIAATEGVLDGEIVALDEQGRPRFGKLQERSKSRGATVHLMLFDVLEVDGESLLDKEYRERRAVLESLVTETRIIHVPPALTGTVDDALRTSETLQLEGIVAKRLTSRYLAGTRSASWVKIKHVQTQEVLIVGWSPGAGNRDGTVGSLLMAVPDGGELTYVGKVGSGFTDRGLREARQMLAKIERRTPQISDVPTVDAKGAHWVTPVHVAEVSYAEWTDSGRLRQPVWKGWRPDKAPTDVRREQS